MLMRSRNQMRQLTSTTRRCQWFFLIQWNTLPSMSSLVSCLLTLRLHLNDCDFGSRPLFLVQYLFSSLYTYTYTYTHCYWHCILYFLLLTKPAPAWVPVKATIVRYSKESGPWTGLYHYIWGAWQLRTGCLSILMFLTPLDEVTPQWTLLIIFF